MIDTDLAARVTAWIADDPDPTTRAELTALLDAGDAAGLEDRFAGLLRFGTAGLRSALGAGPNRMNVAVVRRAAGALAAWLDASGATGPVVIGRDARTGSAEFAEATARVLRGAGREVIAFPDVVPTPVLAHATAGLDAALGVMVTASHNPPGDNGYKVYGPGGTQIVPPDDDDIAALMDGIESIATQPLGPPADDADVGLIDDYVFGAAAVRVAPAARTVRVAYTPMHGVGGATLLDVFDTAGLAAPAVVTEQFTPDPTFPTVAFPNPEEPGAMDLVLALATEIDADLALANDPDADRLAAAVPDSGGWRLLTGDELGILLADHLLTHSLGLDRLVLNTVVSSTMLAKLAAAHKVQYVETLTGFKWLARAMLDRPHLRPILGYEEAIGFCVGDNVRDKDGISAAVSLTELVGNLLAHGSSVPARLDELAVAHGLHVTRQRTWRFEGPDGPAAMAAAVDRLRAESPEALGPLSITDVEDLRVGRRLPATDAVILHAAEGRVVLRPSGTEPKLKAYAELVYDVTAESVVEARQAGSEAIDGLLDAVSAMLGI